jgi:hypothetical protein
LLDHAKLTKAIGDDLKACREVARFASSEEIKQRKDVEFSALTTHLRADRLRDYLVVLASAIYILSGPFALGLVIDFVWSLFKRDLSPWWFWPAGVVAVLVLMIIAWNLLRVADKNDYTVTNRASPPGKESLG